MRNSDTSLTNRLWDIPVAFILLTRLPIPALPPRVVLQGGSAVWAYPIVGLVLGAIVGIFGWICGGIGLPQSITAGLVLAVLILLTGAMHEDGLADTADGLWGGQNIDRRLEIMKDSRIGTFGVLALIIAMGLRWMGLSQVTWSALVTALVLSRSMMPPLMLALPTARSTGLSHSVGAPDIKSVAGAVLLGAACAILFSGGAGLFAFLVASIVTAGVGALAKTKIGGQTGDILGATQIVSEISILLTLVAVK